MQELWKLLGLFVMIKSTHEHVAPSKKFCIWQKHFMAFSVSSELKSPDGRKLSYFDESTSVLIYSKNSEGDPGLLQYPRWSNL